MGGNYSFAPKNIPTLIMIGNKDAHFFRKAGEEYNNGFNGYFDEYIHEGEHVYPKVNKQMQLKIHALLDFVV